MHAGRHSTGTFTSDCEQGRVATKGSSVGVSPLEGEEGVEECVHAPKSGARLGQDLLVLQKAKDTEPIVGGDHNDVSSCSKLRAIVT